MKLSELRAQRQGRPPTPPPPPAWKRGDIIVSSASEMTIDEDRINWRTEYAVVELDVLAVNGVQVRVMGHAFTRIVMGPAVRWEKVGRLELDQPYKKTSGEPGVWRIQGISSQDEVVFMRTSGDAPLERVSLESMVQEGAPFVPASQA